jgi:hypothetical protein
LLAVDLIHIPLLAKTVPDQAYPSKPQLYGLLGPLSYDLQVPVCRIYQDETKRLCGRGQNSMKKRTHLGPSKEGELVYETRAAHSACEMGVLKRQGAGESESESELGADFSSYVPKAVKILL